MLIADDCGRLIMQSSHLCVYVCDVTGISSESVVGSDRNATVDNHLDLRASTPFLSLDTIGSFTL